MSANPNGGLSRIVWNQAGDQLYSFEQVAYYTDTSVTVLDRYVELGLIEPIGVMLRREEVVRIIRLRRLRRDLGLNLVGAAMLLDMANELDRVKAQLRAHQERGRSMNP